MNTRGSTALFVLLHVLPGLLGFPTNFVSLYPHGSCVEHPTQAAGLHGTPQNDSSSSIQLLLNGETSETICAGGQYTVQVTFPTPRLGLLTTSVGTSSSDICSAVTSSTGCCTDSSGSRWVLTSPYDTKQDNFTVGFNVPCGIKGPLEVRVTSATGNVSPFYQMSREFQVGTACKVDCVSGATHPPPLAVQPPAAVHNASTPFQAQRAPDKPATSPASRQNSTLQQGSSASEPITPTEGSISLCQHKGVSQFSDMSSLSYSHHLDLGGIMFHYSFGECAPNNPCTQRAARVAGTSLCPGQKLLHIAAVAKTLGYVAVGFGREAREMNGTEAVLGYLEDGTGHGYVQEFKLGDKELGKPLQAAAQMMIYAGVLQGGNAETVLCFARLLAPSQQKGSANFLLPHAVAVNWATSERDKLIPHSQSGGAWVDLDKGRARIVKDRVQFGKQAHGVVMLVVWFWLAPLGVMSARHKWLLPERDVLGVPCWLLVHQLLQCTALAMQLAAGVYAWVRFDTQSGLGMTHKVMGTAAMVLAFAQGAAAFARPKTSHSHARTWAMAHVITGTVLLALGAATCVLGAVLVHYLYHASLLLWLVPPVVSLLLLGALDIALLLWALRVKTRNTMDPMQKSSPDDAESRHGGVVTVEFVGPSGALLV